jgi:hypothetical protein
MAFLDNSGDIILDAVLTDTGRYRLAKGDGSFRIAKFALGDDEIDYSLYSKDHPSGSAYYDLDILQTPILEALTDNASALKSHLLTIAQTDHLFLPIITLFVSASGNGTYDNQGYYAVAADSDTESDPNYVKNKEGVFYTHNKGSTVNNNIVVHQGLDTTKISPVQDLSSELAESVYMIEMDNRLGVLIHPDQLTEMDASYIDDDQIATYLVSLQKDKEVVKNIKKQGTTDEVASSIRGPRGTSLTFKIAASQELQTSTYLFEELGSDDGAGLLFIDTMVRITGATTGYRIDIPVRFVKQTA